MSAAVSAVRRWHGQRGIGTMACAMTMFPFGTLLRLIRLARRGSRTAMLCLAALVVGIALLVIGAIVGATLLLILGAVLCGVGVAGSRPGVRLM